MCQEAIGIVIVRRLDWDGSSKNEIAGRGIWGSCHFPAIPREGPGPTPSSWLSVAQCSTQMAASLLRTCMAGQRYNVHTHGPAFHLNKRRTAEMRGDWIPQRTDFSVGMFSNVLPRNPLQTYMFDTTQRKRGRVDLRHDAMRTDDLHCGSCSASTQFSIHSLPPLWPKAPHGPNSKTT
jgi:hypothetical protein